MSFQSLYIKFPLSNFTIFIQLSKYFLSYALFYWLTCVIWKRIEGSDVTILIKYVWLSHRISFAANISLKHPSAGNLEKQQIKKITYKTKLHNRRTRQLEFWDYINMSKRSNICICIFAHRYSTYTYIDIYVCLYLYVCMFQHFCIRLNKCNKIWIMWSEGINT